MRISCNKGDDMTHYAICYDILYEICKICNVPYLSWVEINGADDIRVSEELQTVFSSHVPEPHVIVRRGREDEVGFRPGDVDDVLGVPLEDTYGGRPEEGGDRRVRCCCGSSGVRRSGRIVNIAATAAATASFSLPGGFFIPRIDIRFP
jgi:hypothetical protein